MNCSKESIGILCFIAGTALSALFPEVVSSTAFVKVINQPGSPIECRDTGKQCDDIINGGQCTVNIQTVSGVVVARAYRSGCTILLTTDNLPGGTVSFFPLPVSVQQ